MYVAAMIRGQTIARNYANPVAVARCLGKKEREREGERWAGVENELVRSVCAGVAGSRADGDGGNE